MENQKNAKIAVKVDYYFVNSRLNQSQDGRLYGTLTLVRNVLYDDNSSFAYIEQSYPDVDVVKNILAKNIPLFSRVLPKFGEQIFLNAPAPLVDLGVVYEELS